VSQNTNRRRFLKGMGALGAAGTIGPSDGGAGESTHRHDPGAAKPPLDAAPGPLLFLTAAESAFLGAAVDRLIPPDELGPGAREAGVVRFIDRQLQGAWGTMAKAYRQGPWTEGAPEQGYQSPLTFQQLYRAAIHETDLHCGATYGKRFAELSPERQDEVLQGLDEGRIALRSAPSALFFNLLWANTQEGFFSDPMYGGNRDKLGWRLVGFPGVAAAYTEHVERYNVPYSAEPVAIGDVVAQRVQLDPHGHPVHVRAGAKG
jgi:gluconate 2-dehydrogenase gamma chain